MTTMSRTSRLRYCHAYADAEGRLYLDEREPFPYRDEPDNVLHTVVEGDTWWGLVWRYLQGAAEYPERLWWLLCEYQPTPVLDPTLCLVPGTLVIIPSLRLVRMKVFSDQQRQYH